MGMEFEDLIKTDRFENIRTNTSEYSEKSLITRGISSSHVGDRV
jgi:hypothetical protein